MTTEENFTPEEIAKLEISLPTSLELCRLGLATMIDIRQTFEIELKGAIPDTEHIPMFEMKVMLGHTLTEDEQDILDAGEIKEMDAKSFFTTINKLHHTSDQVPTLYLQQRSPQFERSSIATQPRLPESTVSGRWFCRVEEAADTKPRLIFAPGRFLFKNQRQDVVGQQQADSQHGAGQYHIGYQADAGCTVLLHQGVYAAEPHAPGNQGNQAGNLHQHRRLARHVVIEMTGAGH